MVSGLGFRAYSFLQVDCPILPNEQDYGKRPAMKTSAKTPAHSLTAFVASGAPRVWSFRVSSRYLRVPKP